MLGLHHMHLLLRRRKQPDSPMHTSENPALICLIILIIPFGLCLGLGALAGWLANEHGKMWERKLTKEKKFAAETESWKQSAP